MSLKCNGDCLNCIYDDCVATPIKESRGSTQDRKEYFRQYYLKNKERKSAYYKEMYQKKYKNQRKRCEVCN